MERKIEKFLSKWKNDVIRKPLIVYGPKQVGKTFSILSFGEKEYKNIVYFNTNNNKEIDNLFEKEKATDKIIMNLSLISGETILKEDTLIILDNVDNKEIAKVESVPKITSKKFRLSYLLIMKKRISLNFLKWRKIP